MFMFTLIQYTLFVGVVDVSADHLAVQARLRSFRITILYPERLSPQQKTSSLPHG